MLRTKGSRVTELGSIRRLSVSDEVVNSLLTSIASGQFEPGERLPTEPELARQLGVGRTSIREAIARLRVLGALEVRRGLGTFVTEGANSDPRLGFVQWTAEHLYQIIDIFEVRISLETTAASLAATRATEADLQNLELKASDHSAAAIDGSLDDLVRTDQMFHDALLRSSNNEALQRVYGVLVPELIPYRRKSLALQGAPTRSAQDHLAIVEAIRGRQSVQAHSAALKHLSILYEEIVRAQEDGEIRQFSPAPLVWNGVAPRFA
jgi:GntR family transcriptional regulator, transcriptional repressor for pyruvate dehydrogenase complex